MILFDSGILHQRIFHKEKNPIGVASLKVFSRLLIIGKIPKQPQSPGYSIFEGYDFWLLSIFLPYRFFIPFKHKGRHRTQSDQSNCPISTAHSDCFRDEPIKVLSQEFSFRISQEDILLLRLSRVGKIQLHIASHMGKFRLAAAKSSKANTQADPRGEDRQTLSWHIPENII